jgi:hypothetical protein
MEQNQAYCNYLPFNEAVCSFDGGIYCPERCGVCAAPMADPATSTTVRWSTKIATEVHLFDRTAYRTKLGAALGISRNRISLQVTAGSIDVVSSIVTAGGSQAEADALVSSISSTFTSPEVASALLDVEVASFDLPTTITVSPSLPPYPPIPPSPVVPSPPLTPPGVVHPPEMPPPRPPESQGMSALAISAIVVAGVLVLLTVVAGCVYLQYDAKEAAKPEQSVAKQQSSVTVAPVAGVRLEFPTATYSALSNPTSKRPAGGILFRLS